MITSYLGHAVDKDWLASTVRDLGVLTLAFGERERATRHPDGVRPETVTTHTVMLGLIACSLGDRINASLPAGHPARLNLGIVAQLVLVHDLPEVYADDTSTLRLLTAEQLAEKTAREAAASARITRQFGDVLPWLSLTLGAYEAGTCHEVDYVWGCDKLCPKPTHIANGCAVPRAAGVTVAELTHRYAVQRGQMMDRCRQWPALIAVYDRLVEEELEALRCD